MPVTIVKADGTSEHFNIDKLRRSLRRAGADHGEIDHIVGVVSGEIYDGITTQAIYRRAFALLRESERPAAARYSLRRALFGLGPTGFPFETYLGRLFQTQGYTTATGVTIPGKCAEHEIDLTAYKADHSFVAEAKFHARPGIKSDLQVVMYCYARLLDLKGRQICSDDVCGITDYRVITNTKFTSAAIRYGECVGMQLLSWDYPTHDNLHDHIQRAGLYPVTVLQSLTTAQAATLIERGAIVCHDLLERPQLLRHLHVSQRKSEAILQEAGELTAKQRK